MKETFITLPKKNDEIFTPKILAEAIEKYLILLCKKFNDPIIGLPFDTEESEFAYLCRKLNLKYICSHISTGQDFFEYEPKKGDIALSNPPFSKKLAVFKRLAKLGKPGAMLMTIAALNYQEIGEFFVECPCQFLIVDKRISFDGKPNSFNTSYICSKGFLPKDSIFVHLENNNTNKYFVPSRMLIQYNKKKGN